MYRGHGFAGYALLFMLAPILILLGMYQPRFGNHALLISLMLVALSAKLLWCGMVAHVFLGFILLSAFAMALVGLPPHLVELAVFVSQAISSGYEGLRHYWLSSTRVSPTIKRTDWLTYGLPPAACLVFSVIFLMANPDLVADVSRRLWTFFTTIHDWILEIVQGPMEILFWLAVGWISIGLIRPVARRTLSMHSHPLEQRGQTEDKHDAPSSFYLAYRNTLLAVIVLFAVYLVFEFMTLWFREFPEGFYYSGYAHQGAAWLTAALALATMTLSIVFGGSVLQDARLPTMRKLAWIWSAENFLLAAAVYNRLAIYASHKVGPPISWRTSDCCNNFAR